MGTTSWRHAGLSLILDVLRLEQGRATADGSRRRIIPPLVPGSAEQPRPVHIFRGSNDTK